MKKQQYPKKNQNKFAKNHYDDEIARIRKDYESLSADYDTFDDMPLSQKTKKGLAEAKFRAPTEIQKRSIAPALQGKDVLAAAITGSGKTLAFLVPVLEHLYMSKWSRTDGVCAIIISPTRELAYQIFETLRLVGRYHDFSAGLIIGGKNLKFERRRIDQCNIFICTPGRLLQHMDENPLFNVSTMEMLILDEADRCLDMGFEKTLNAIIENFPPARQTLLFSATQTNSIKDLARLNLKNPVYIGIKKEEAFLSVPELLQQSYVVIPLEEKITMLWSFIKNHTKQKIIVFLSTCKQVKYIYEIFCKLRPGISLLALYGTLHQDRRIAIYNDFVKKGHVVLFATDVASRGLDFPAVNWVVQLDCPEDVAQYVHRAGRSARNKTHGESLLVLQPTEEEEMISELSKQSISVRKIAIDPKKMFSPRAKIEAFLAQNPELKASAQRAFLAYIKSVFLMKNKKIFKVFDLDFDAYAKSLGLVLTPRVRFLEKIMHKRQAINASKDTDNVATQPAPEKNLGFNSEFSQPNSDTDSDDDFIKVKRLDHEIREDLAAQTDSEAEQALKPVKKEKLVTKAKIAKKVLKKNIQINVKKTFNESGEEVVDPRKELQSELAKQYQDESEGGINLVVAKQLLSEEDKYDKQRFRELVKQRHKKMKEKLKNKNIKLVATDDEESEEEVLNNGYSDEESVDLSWLPDPDKIYKHKLSGDDAQPVKFNMAHSADEDDSSASDDEQPAHKKSKITEKLTLDDAEAIAAKLLANDF